MDGDLADPAGSLLSNLATVTIAVTNQKPLANDDVFLIPHGQDLLGNVGGNDSDLDWDLLSYSLVSGPSHGTLLPQADGSAEKL